MYINYIVAVSGDIWHLFNSNGWLVEALIREMLAVVEGVYERVGLMNLALKYCDCNIC